MQEPQRDDRPRARWRRRLAIPAVVALAATAAALAPTAARADVVPTPHAGSPTSYNALTPARLLDTRAGGATIDGAFNGIGALGQGQTVDLTVVGRGGVPTTGVGAVVLNVTATDSSVPGFLTVFPTGSTRPNASNLNFVAGQTIPNLVIAKVGNDGKVSIYNNSGSTHVVADVEGWLPPTAAYTGLTPARLLDTRPSGATVDGAFKAGGAIGQGQTLDLPVLGRGGVPVAGVGSVVLNVTATEPTVPGFLTVFPTGSTRPLASNLNFVASQTIPNLVIAKVGNDGKVSIFNNSGSTQVVADVEGWFPTTSSFTGLTPARVLDTRSGGQTVDGGYANIAAIGQGKSIDLIVTGRGGLPAAGVGAVALNITVADPDTPSFLTVWPTGAPRPLASNLNFVAGQTIPNLVIAKVGDGGKVSIYNNSGNAHVVADVAGYFPDARWDLDARAAIVTPTGPVWRAPEQSATSYDGRLVLTTRYDNPNGPLGPTAVVVDHVTGPTNFLGGYVSFAVSPEGSEALVRNGAQWSRWVPASGAVTPLPGPCAILSSAAWATQVRLVVDGVGVCTGPNATPQAPVGQYSRLGLFNARQSGGHVIVTNSAGATVSDIVSGATPAVGSVADNGAVLLPTPGGPGIFAPGTAAPKFAVNAPTSAIISPDGGYIVWTTGTDASGRFGVEVNSSATATDQIATLPGQASCYRNTVGGSFVWPLYLGGCAA